jgi:hypothetical protein
MLCLLPASMGAQGTDRALLHSNGGTLLNGSPAPGTSAVFPDNLIQTPPDQSAAMEVVGSSANVLPETMVQFQADELVLDHGQLQITTARALRVRVGCITIIPTTLERTQYDVIDRNGKVNVIAYQHDVEIRERGATAHTKKGESSNTIVRQGQQATREEKCGAAAKPNQPIDGTGPILNSLPAKIAGAGIIIAVTCYALCHTDDPVSPWIP